MNDNSLTLVKQDYSKIRVIFISILALWTILIGVMLLWEINIDKKNTRSIIMAQAKSFYKQIVITRLWSSVHGGVYVPVTEITQPNPYLDVPKRDVTTTDGTKLTLINPAYMTRQIAEIAFEKGDIRFHITSLNPIRPANKAEEWERKALSAFKGKMDEFSEWDKEKPADKQYFRYMAPLIVETPCLKCHAKQGYKEGDIRGGISVSVPAGDLLAVQKNTILNSILGYLIIWFFGSLGIATAFYFVRNDIRSRNKLNAELYETKGSLETSMKEKDKFFSVIAHDLKSPFTGVLGLSQIITDDIENFNPSEIKNIVEKLHTSIGRLFKLLENLLEWSRLQRGLIKLELVKIPVKKLVEENTALFASKAELKNIRIFSNVPDDLEIVADKQILSLVLRNLISNSVKFTPNGGEITITVSDENKQTRVSVKDNGIGIPPEIISVIFKVGEKISRLGTEGEESTGLGLIICKEFIEKHGGTFSVISETGKGAEFTFLIPK